MIFYPLRSNPVAGACLFTGSEEGFRFIFSRLIGSPKKKAQRRHLAGLNEAGDLALFLCPWLHVILRRNACRTAGQIPLHSDGAAK